MPGNAAKTHKISFWAKTKMKTLIGWACTGSVCTIDVCSENWALLHNGADVYESLDRCVHRFNHDRLTKFKCSLWIQNDCEFAHFKRKCHAINYRYALHAGANFIATETLFEPWLFNWSKTFKWQEQQVKRVSMKWLLSRRLNACTWIFQCTRATQMSAFVYIMVFRVTKNGFHFT